MLSAAIASLLTIAGARPASAQTTYTVGTPSDLIQAITDANSNNDYLPVISLSGNVTTPSGTVVPTGTATGNGSGNGIDIATGTFTLTLSGAGTSWNAGTYGGAFDVDGSGSGGLTVANGAQLVIPDTTEVGFLSFNSGTLTVTGSGSSVTTDYFAVGRGGDATIMLTDGGQLTTNVASIGEGPGYTVASNITVLVDGAGTLWNAGSFSAGGATNSVNVTVSNGAMIQAGSAGIGVNGAASLLVTGAGSQFQDSGVLEIGELSFGTTPGQGTVTISDGALVSALGGVLVGADSGTSGTLIVNTNGVLETAALLPGAGGATAIFNNGTLRASADSTPNSALIYGFAPGAFIIGSGGMYLDSNGFNVTAATVMSGVGGLTKQGAGTLTLTLANTYTGGTTITSGTLQLGDGGTSGSIVGNVTDNGTLAFDRSDAVTFSGVVNGSGALNQIGTGTTILNGANTYTGGTTITSGTLQLGDGGTSGSIVGNVIDNGTLAFNRSDDVSFDGAISGSGGVDQIGSGMTALTNISSYTGATNVTAGVLIVNGSIANSAVNVASDATLAGTGTVGATLVQAGGTIAPTGMSTLSVNGNYVQSGGSTYQVNANPNSDASSRIAVNGTATLDSGAIINVTKTPDAPYVLGDKYTVLTATGGVTGTFTVTGQTAVSAFLALAGSYDANDAYLTVMQTGSPFGLGKTPNQNGTGNGLGSVAPTSPAGTAVLNSSSPNAARAALDQLSGEIYASVRTAMQEDSHYSRDAATDRMREAFCGVGGDTPIQDSNHPRVTDNDCSSDPDRLVAWGQLFGAWGYNDGNGNAAKLDHSTGGLFIGADAPISDWRIGALAGYGRSGFDVNERTSSASSDDYYLGVYSGTQWGALGFRTGATYTWHDLDSNRILDLPGLPGAVGANYDASSTQVFGDLGYRIDAGTASYEPFADLAYTRLHTDGFTETGPAGLTAEGDDMNTTFATLGLRASNAFQVDGTEALVRGSIGWRHSFGDITPVSSVAFAGGSDFDISGVAIARNSAVADLGLDVRVAKNATLGIAYFGEFGSGAVDQGVRGTFHLDF
jgi:fibronectin-binding autotransporter adhesin